MARENGFWYRLGSGFVIGLAMVIPGVSGGILAMVLGLYEPIIAAIAKPLENLRENIRLLVPLGLGAASCLLLLSRVLEFLFSEHPLPTLYFFFGLVVAGLPTVVKIANVKGFRLSYLVSLALGISLIVFFTRLPAYFGQGVALTSNFFSSVLKGSLMGVGLVIPGLSASMLLIAFGFYEELLRAVAQFNLHILVPAGLGVIPAVFLASRLVNCLFNWKHGHVYYAILGLMFGSLAVAFPGLPRTALELLVCLGLFGSGMWVASVFSSEQLN
ncbi:MAG: DUF368 domain-containing protein [Firmicutes bacterium]|nr:DUF368 domain-containing protein [Bacillota bacterium]